MSKQYRRWLMAFDRQSPFVSKAHRALFYALCGCLSLYIAWATFFMNSPVFTSGAMTALCLALWLAESALVFALLLWGIDRLRGMGKPLFSDRERLSLGFFLLTAGLCAAVLGLNLVANYPGCVSYDVFNQWEQVQSGVFTNWHPVAHTLLLWLTTRVVNHYAFVLSVQILALSLSLAYLLSALHAWGVGRWPLLMAEALVVTSSVVCNTAMYAWKDNAMSVGMLILMGQCVNLYASRGKWLSKRSHGVALGAALALTTLMRHNAALLTLPLLVTILAYYREQWKRGLLCVLTAAIVYAGITGPLYSALHVTYPDNTMEESIGLPMTIVCDIRVKNEEALAPETREFLDSLMPRDTLEAIYMPGNYNSIKFEYPREKINQKPLSFYLRMFSQAVRSDPRNAFLAVRELTDLVWDVSGKCKSVVAANNNGDMSEYRFWNTHMNQIGQKLMTALTAVFNAPPITYVTQNIGVQTLLLLLFTLFALWRCGQGALMFGFPVIVYNLGTMLLLCGPDTRFFQFAMLVSLPLCLLLSHPIAKEEDDLCK